jgi:hemerythrin
MDHSFFPWKQDYSVYVDEIDNQHKKLIDILNVLYDSFLKKEHQAQIGEILGKLKDYTQYHFRTEEEYLKRVQYPQLSQHMSEHMIFEDKIRGFQHEYSKNPSALTYKLMLFLKDWLRHHILDSDRRYVPFLRKQA